MKKCSMCEHYSLNFNGVRYCAIIAKLRVNDSIDGECSYFKKKE